MKNNLSHRISYIVPSILGIGIICFLLFGVSNVFAQASAPTTTRISCEFAIQTFEDIFVFPLCFINRFLIPLAIAVEIIIFLWGIVQFVLHADEDTNKSIAKAGIFWSLIAIFVTLSMWGIVKFFSESIGIEQQGGAVEVPQFDVS